MRPFVTEHRPHIIKFGDGIFAVQFILNERTHHRGRPFGTQGQGVAALIVESVHFLFDDVGGFADGTTEKFGFLHHSYNFV